MICSKGVLTKIFHWRCDKHVLDHFLSVICSTKSRTKMVLFWNQFYRTCILIRTLVLFGISVFIRNTLYFRSSTRRSPIHQNDWFVEAVIITFHKPWASKLHTLHFFTYLKLFLSWDRILIHEECLSERKFPSKFLIWRWQPKNISILTKI